MRGLRAGAGAFALAFSAGWNVANTGAVATRLAHDYETSLAVVGLFTTALFVSHAAMQIPSGRLCDRFGPRRVGIAGLVIIAVFSAAALLVRDPAFAIVLRGLTGIGTALAFVAGSAYIRATAGSPFAQGLYGAMSMAGGGLALAIVPQLPGWRAPFSTAVVAAGVGAILIVAAPRERARQVLARGRLILRDARLYRLGVIHAASFGLSVVLGNWVTTLLERAGGYGAGMAGALGASTLALGILTRPGGGWVMRNRPGRTNAAVAVSFLAGAAGTVLLLIAHPLPFALAGAIVVGLAAGVPFAPAFSGAALARPDAPGAAIGLVNMVAAVTILVGTPLLGLSFSLPGDGRIGFAILAALWAAAVLALPTVVPTAGTDPVTKV